MRLSASYFRSLFLMLALCVSFGGCAPSSSGTVWAHEAAPANPRDAYWATTRGSHVRVAFGNGKRVTGYLIEKHANAFTLRGIGWLAGQVTTYELDDVVEFAVSEPQPNTEGVRY